MNKYTTVRKRFPMFIRSKMKNKFRNNKGQSLVEFVLLLSVILLISLSFLRLTNNNIANVWKNMANKLVENPNAQSLEFF